MTAPTWVGTTYVDPDDSWSLSWTITSADLPAGTQSGDLLLLWLIADTQSTSSTFAPLGGWGLSGDWTLVRNQQSSSSTPGYVGCFRSTYVAGALPQTLIPKSSTNATIDRQTVSGAGWYGLLMAYRPSGPYSAAGGYSSSLTATTIYGGSGTPIFPDGVAGGATVGVAATTGATPTLSTTADFVVQDDGPLIDWRSGARSVGYIESATLGNYIWVGGTNVLKFDPSTLTPVAYYDSPNSGTFLFDMTFDGQTSPGLWFCDGVNVYKLDLTAGTFSSAITVGNGPSALVFGAGSVWVGHSNDNTIKRIDPATATVSATITLGTTERAGECIYAVGFAWFLGNSGNVFKIDPTTNAVTTITALPDLVSGIAYDGTKIWAVSNRDGAIYTINTSTNAVTKQTATFFLSSSTGDLVWDGSYMWVRDGTNVKRIDPTTYTVAATVAVSGNSSDQMAYMLGYLYVGDYTANVVRKIDVTTDTVVDTYDTDLAKRRGGYSHIDRQFASAYSGTKPQWTKSTTVYGAAVFAAFGAPIVPTTDQWGMNMVRW